MVFVFGTVVKHYIVILYDDFTHLAKIIVRYTDIEGRQLLDWMRYFTLPH